jgi:nitroreductase
MADVLDVEERELQGRELRTALRHAAIPHIPPGSDWNQTEELILRRRSVRKFKGRQVPDYLIRRVLEVARFSPSQGNCQPWSFIVVRERDMIAQMEAYCVAVCKAMTAKLDYTNYPKGTWKRYITQLKTRFMNKRAPNALHPVPMTAIKSIAAGRFRVFHKAPTVILLLMDKRGVGSPEIDIGVMGQNLVIAAQSLGIGTCWIGFSKMLNSNKALVEKLGVEPPFEIVEAISLGYPLGDPTLNHVSRQTHQIIWWEDGKKQVLF